MVFNRPIYIKIVGDTAQVIVSENHRGDAVFGGSRLFAEEMVLPQAIDQNVVSDTDISRIQAEVISIVEEYKKSAIGNIEEFNINDDKGLTTYDKMAVYSKMMEVFNIDIPVKYRNWLTSIESITKYIISMKKINAYVIDNKLPQYSNFYDQINALPKELRPTIKK